MKPAILIALLFLGCSYTKADIGPIAIMTGGTIADAIATDKDVRGGAEERNPVYGPDPSGETLAVVAAVKVAVILVAGTFIPEKWHKLRRWIFGAVGVVSAGAAVSK